MVLNEVSTLLDLVERAYEYPHFMSLRAHVQPVGTHLEEKFPLTALIV